MKDVRKAIQLYLFRSRAAMEMRSILSFIRELGYDGVEFCGLFGHDPAEVRGWLGELGLAAVSDHVTFGMLADGLEETIRVHKALGCEFITLGWLDEERRHYGPDFDGTLSALSRAEAACRAAGLPLAYHNHNFEFRHVSEKNGLEMMLDGVPGLQAQFDAGWLKISGQDPVALLDRYAGRYISVHLKDYLRSDGEKHDFCPLGMGVAGISDAIQAAVRGGARWIIVDQDDDDRRGAGEAARLSTEYLNSLGY